jgi:hypothetical protein
MAGILTKGMQVRERGAGLDSPWRVVGQGRHGVICRRAQGGNVTTRCFKPEELQRTEEPSELVRSLGEEDVVHCLG